mgnify:CR=1 FL=1
MACDLLICTEEPRYEPLRRQIVRNAGEGQAALLTRIESEPGWFDADRLAFKEVLEQLATGLKASQTLDGIKLARRAQDDIDTLAEVQKAFSERYLKEVQ